jgi:hypothetical protein
MAANTDPYYSQQLLAQQALQSNSLGLLNYGQLGTATNAYTTAATTSIVYLDSYQRPEPAVVPVAPTPDDEFTWLRKRVAETCWKN